MKQVETIISPGCLYLKSHRAIPVPAKTNAHPSTWTIGGKPRVGESRRESEKVRSYGSQQSKPPHEQADYPAYLGYKMLDVMLDVEAEYAKPDMIRKLGLIDSVIVIINFLGKAMKVTLLYNSEESRSRMIELISRITAAERVAVSRGALPRSETQRLTEADQAILGALSKDARKSSTAVAKELGLSARTISNRIERLRRERTIFMFPNLNMTNIVGFIPAALTYTYSRADSKSSVDRSVLSHFDSSFLWGGLSDSERGSIVLSAPTIADVPRFVEWAKSQPGIATARVGIPLQLFSFPEKLGELLKARQREHMAL